MKLKWISALVLAGLLMVVVGTAVAAQGEVPPPYAGMKNPFPWTDASSQTAGAAIFKQNCIGCHGAKGDGIPAFNFSKAEYGTGIEARPDFYFWVVSEGRLSNGMPPFKGSLSEDKRWQVLTYIRSLSTGGGGAAPATTAPAAKGQLQLSAPEQGHAGEPIALKATLQDDKAKPIADATVKFYLDEKFLPASALMEIGEATTDADGIATLEYKPNMDGKLAAVAKYGDSEARANVDVVGGVESVYHTDAGLHFPVVGKSGDIIFPKSVLTLRGLDRAPLPAFRLPGGILSWLLVLVAIIFMIWFTYFRVMRQIFLIPNPREIRDVNTRLVPMIGMGMVIMIGIGLILKLLITPYSHLHIPPF